MTNDINSRNCPHCSRGENQGHHAECPENPDNKVTAVLITQAQLATLRAAWDLVPDSGVVGCSSCDPSKANGAWLQPLINAVTDIVNPGYQAKKEG